MFYKSQDSNRSPLQHGRVEDLHVLPKLRDKSAYLYIEHARIEKDSSSIAIWDADGCTPAPVASLAVLLLGPGTTISQGAISVLADNNCLVAWCGEEAVRFYACGTGGTRSSRALLHQARLWADEESRLRVARRMYQARFGEGASASLSVEQLRGLEGVRVREAYARLARESEVAWTGRNYDRGGWDRADLPNRALSCATSCLYGLCHAAILSAGYSPAIGFIHTGKGLSFVLDIADLYKLELAVPVAFRVASENPPNLERAVRLRCRDAFRQGKLLARVIPDIQMLLESPPGLDDESPLDDDPSRPTDLWTPDHEDSPDSAEDEHWAQG